ncbi:threonine/serine exporter family protein [Nesterenkonia sp. E16_7]|uniref:threonine/serine ThrE exporter family protein n=1 Tax=unclassified Nesterenkonia TaxID=2629769 RepID=UPI001A912322|nr:MULTISPECIES: threonine/serine exporter family protein [unclassified Nesterenkonia]MBO0594697.1 threonine/serine exporter family protein [Nesterenkonia sp. E16_10]MBO0597446.1 threonine/serine exporter family protein [Nesterenkonia sp. E16_7]
MSQDASQVGSVGSASDGDAAQVPAEESDEDAASPPADAIDPRIDREDRETLLRPLVRPTQEIEDEQGFARTLTQHVVDSWNHAAAEEAHHDWPEAQSPPEAAPDTESYRFEDLSAPPLFPSARYFPPDADLGSEPWPDSRAALYDHAVYDHPHYDLPWEDPAREDLPAYDQSSYDQSSYDLPAYDLDGLPGRSAGHPQVPSLGAPGPPARRIALPARRLAQKLISPVSSATGQMSTLDWLSGTPFENPHQAQEPGEDDELVTINLVLDLGESLFRYGAGALEVETSILAVTSAFGMKNTDVDITNQSIILNWSPPGKIPYSRVRVVRSWSANFRALAEVHTLVTDIAFGRITRAEADETLQDILRDPKPYPRWVVATAGALFAGLFASYTGAPLLDASLGFLATLLVLAVTRQLTIWRVPEIFTLAVGGFLATAVALCALTLGAPITTSMVVAGGLMILLPSVRIVSAIQDAINAFPITAAGRLVSSLVAFSGLTAGIMVGVVLTGRAGAPELDVTREIMRIYHPGVLTALVFLTAITAAIVQQAPYRLLLPTGAVAALGFGGVAVGELMGFGGWFTPILGATVVGALARVVALRLRAPQLVVAVPAMMFMLPGLIIFRGMYQIAISQSSVNRTAGLYEIFDALIIIMAIAAGIVLGDVLMRPLTKRLQSNERTKGRRR